MMEAYFATRTQGYLLFGRRGKQHKFKSAYKNCYKELGLIGYHLTCSESHAEADF